MKQQDPLAVAFFGAALALLAGLLLYVLVFGAPEPAAPARPARPGLVEELQRFVAAIEEQIRDQAAPRAPDKRVAAVPAAPKAGPAAKSAPPPNPPGPVLEAGRVWRYAVTVEPPIWRDITLTYRTQREGAGIGVLTDFVHAGGKMNFHLGTFAAGHPSHANTRFPGFFMYPSYFRLPLQPGQELTWSWPWQPASQGRMKRYVARMLRWEDVRVPAGTYRAALIEANLYYVEGEQLRANAKEMLWYAPQVSQLVKVVRDGRTPDEGASRIVAELAEFR